MISFHPDYKDASFSAISKGFKWVNSDDIYLILKCAMTHVWSPIIWNNGERKQSNFKMANWLVMDFDDGEMTLAEAKENIFCDMTHFIGLTKSHQKEKGGKPPCDRFRVVIPFERTITDLNEYKYNLQIVAKRYPIDTAMCDGADYFFPCTDIVSLNDDGFKWDVEELDKTKIKNNDLVNYNYKIERHKQINESFGSKTMPGWVSDFLKRNKMPKWHTSRNWAVWQAQLVLLEWGWEEKEILDLCHNCELLKSTGFNPNWIPARLKSALQRFNDNKKSSK